MSSSEVRDTTQGPEVADSLAGVESFFSEILRPGSSLHPTFLAILDGSFASLFVILAALAFLTSGNLHVFALIAIELALWASVKWFVNELKNTVPTKDASESTDVREGKKDQ